MTTNSLSPSGSFYPQDFSLEQVEITTASGQKFNIRGIVVELSFFEDLYSFVTSGYVIIKDAVGLVEKLNLTGNEFINITYGKTKTQSDDGKVKRNFRLYKVGNRKPLGNLNAEYATFYFCNEILLLSEQTKISKAYTGKKIATFSSNEGIINNILSEKLRINPNRIVEIEETYGTYDFVVPRLKPLEAISWLSTYARPTGNRKGADMLFFETKDGFMFKSLQSLLKAEPYATYKYQQKNLDLDKKSFQEGVITVLDYEIVKSFDVLGSTSDGVFANRLISIDPLTKSYKVTDFNYEKYAGNDGAVISPTTNKLGVKQTQAYDGKLKVAMGNFNQTRVDYIKENQGSTAKDIHLETFVPNRTAQLGLANYTILKMSIPGDSSLTVGRTVNFNLYSLQNGDSRELDEYFSGKYLVTAVRHVMQTQGVYQTFVEIAKQNVDGDYASQNNSSPEMKEMEWYE